MVHLVSGVMAKLYYLVNETTDELLEKARGEYYETMLANTLMKWLGMYR